MRKSKNYYIASSDSISMVEPLIARERVKIFDEDASEQVGNALSRNNSEIITSAPSIEEIKQSADYFLLFL